MYGVGTAKPKPEGRRRICCRSSQESASVKVRLGPVQCWWPSDSDDDEAIGVSTTKAHYFLVVGRPRGDYAPLVGGVVGKGLALRTALETLMATESNCSVNAMATAFKKMSLDLQDHKEFIVQQVEDFDRYLIILLLRATYQAPNL